MEQHNTKSRLVLVLNCGSSSIKFALIDPASTETKCSGLVQRINSLEADLQIKFAGQKQLQQLPNISYADALQEIIKTLRTAHSDLYQQIFAVGHRVVHGGEHFVASAIIDDEILKTLHQCVSLAPLHNPANIMGIDEARKAFPKLPQVAVFDTAFHQSMPPHAFIYPVPYEYYKEYQVRRYGFHGTSHRFVSQAAAKKLARNSNDSAFITAHLGNGCSAAAILNGKSIDTTMGLTPLEGLMMGTRAGDVDPGLHAYLADNLGLNVHKITEILNKKSGLLGISGYASDMRTIESAMENNDKRALLAMEIFCYRLAKHIGALAVPLQRIDALIFTGGIGENSPIVREKTLNWLKIFGFKIDTTRNEVNGKQSNGIITTDDSNTMAVVIPTNEELLIAQDTAALAT
jgi:acetate kinase